MKILIILLISLILLAGCGESPEITDKQELPEPSISFSKSINDASEDCISLQTSSSIKCDKAVDIISADINHKDEIITVEIELAGKVPSSKYELETGELGAETYQYKIFIKKDGKWKSILFGDVTDTLGISGGCGYSHPDSCVDSQVDFSVNNNKVKIVGPLKSKIDKIKIETLYQPGSLDEDDMEDIVEG